MALSIYQLAEEINLFHQQRKQIHAGYGTHRFVDFLNYRHMGMKEIIPDIVVNYFDDQNDFYENLMISCMELPIDKIDDLADILHTQDAKDHSIAGYCSQSREFILLQAMQSAAGTDSEALDWVVTRKLERSAQLMTLSDPLNFYHMGVFAEAATLLDTMTGRGFTDEHHHKIFAKTRHHPIIAESYDEIVDFCEETIAILTEGPEQYEENIYENHDRFDFDVDMITQTLLPEQYALSECISIAPQPDPFASIDEQEQILPHLQDMAEMLLSPYAENFERAAEEIILNLDSIDEYNTEEVQNYCRPWPRLIMS